MPVQRALLEALENLGEEDFRTLKWYLSTKVLDGCKPIARCHLESAKRTDTVNRLIDSYGEDAAVEVSVHVLKNMNQNNTARELQQAYAAEKASGPGPGVLGGPGTSAAPHMMAQSGSVIVAPTVSGGSAGTWNITISK